MNEITLLIIGAVFGFLIGYFFGKWKAYQKADLSQQSGLISNLNTQITEMKTKFEEIEKSREKLDNEKEKRIKEMMESNNKFFKEASEHSKKSDEEKEKRINEIMESNKKFLEHQGKSREEIEKQRDAQVKDMKIMIERFTQTVSGTKTRGMVGETILEDVLKNSIKARVVKKNLSTDNGEVEFAWNLGDGKFIPIDSKLPDVFEIIDEYYKTESDEQKRKIIKRIYEKIKKEIKNIQKYQNLSNTIDNCILVVPPAILDMCPELVSLGRDENVFVCSYKDVFPIAHILQEQYIKFKEEGDIGEYKRIIKSLFQILDKINKKCASIEKAVTTIKNANENIKDEIIKGKRQELNVKKTKKQ